MQHLNFQGMSAAEKTALYISFTRPVLNTQALFSDGSDFYCHSEKTAEGWRVRLRIRTARSNADKVSLIIGGIRYEMRLGKPDKSFDYYETQVLYPKCGSDYYFEIVSGKMKVFYNRRGVMREVQAYYNFKLMPEFSVPDWAKGAVFYQIFVDRFFNGDKSNDVLDHEYTYIHRHVRTAKRWDSAVRIPDFGRFYGGDLQGVLDKLDYLQSLGVEVLYLNPIFVSPSSHKYDTQDYDHVDPHFGRIVKDAGDMLEEWDQDNRNASRFITRVTDPENLEASNKFFADFVAEVHRRGMKVVLDGVFNHCGSFNKWLDGELIYEGQPGYETGAFVSQDSPYHDFFKFNSESWPMNKDYVGWWEHATLPKLNYEESEKLCSYIMNIARKWVSPPYNADGWRLDVAADLGKSQAFNHQFWRDFRKAVKDANPNAVILAEHYTDPAEWLDGTQWDTVMNYQAFMEPVSWFMTGVEKHSDDYREDLLNNFDSFETAMSHHMSRMPHDSILSSMNELSNHDHSRFMTRTSHQVGRLGNKSSANAEEFINEAVFRAAVMIQMTWPGAPTVYYGDEAGLCGWTDPDNRRPYPWGHENERLIAFHKDVIRIHRESSALRTGSLKMLGGSEGILLYGRFDQKERYAIAVNNRNADEEVRIPVWQIGTVSGSCMVRRMMSISDSYTTDERIYNVTDGMIQINLPKQSAIILKEI